MQCTGKSAVLLGVVLGSAAVAASAVGVTPASGSTRAAALPACTMTAAAGQHVLVGTRGDDVLCAGTATSKVSLIGRAGDDVLIGGSGRDVLVGGPGDDRLHGFGGDDVLVGGPGVDRLSGGRGDDLLVDNSADGSEVGGRGVDRCVGGTGTSFAECEWVNGGRSFPIGAEG
jgi:Ca2+-binding RTX toxin-like protein